MAHPGVRRILVFVCIVLMAILFHAAVHAQATGWLDVTMFVEPPDGSASPLAGVTIQLLAADGSTVASDTTSDAGNARLVGSPGLYTLTAAHEGYTPTAARTCGETEWAAAVADSDGKLQEPLFALILGRQRCRQYLFTANPPPAPPPQPPAPEPTHPFRPVYLTFDDGYINLCATVALVHTLHIHVTFFLTGQAILTFPDCVRALVADGNALGNHTYAHEDLTRLSASGIAATFQRTESAALAVAGVSTQPLCRPPYGRTNSAVRTAALNWGCRLVMWDRDTRDWAGVPATSVEASALSVNCAGEVVLMHTQAFPRDQVALPYIVDVLRQRGCDIVAIAQ